MKLIIMTKPTFFVEEDKILTTLFEEGMDNLHLNKPSSEPVFSERLLTLLPDDYYHHITVHNHFYLREEYGLRGIHLSTPAEELPYGYKGHVSCTCPVIDDLRWAKKHMDYVFIEPQRHSAEELRDAQAHPEKYENLQVRVCGWNVRRNDMSKAEQDAYIRRAENVMQAF